jgi:outer membrane protein assembly factor BamB
VNNFLKIILIFIFITNCSLHKSSNFWKKQKIIKEKKENIIVIAKKEENLSSEFNSNLKISLYSKAINKSFLNNFDNNNGRIDFDGELKSISKYKFSKIKNFYQYDPKISFYKNDIIFFDNKGSILRFNNDSDLIWKQNNYTKSEKKQNPILLFANNNKILIVADNISKYYALDIDTGEVLWSKNNTAPFNSQLKIYKDKAFVIDYENVLRAYSINEGNEIWNIRTGNSLIRSQKKLSMVIIENKIYFNNSSGDISSVDVESGELLWQTPTQSNLVYDESFFLKTSDIIADNETLFFSNNKNEFFSLDIQTGTLNWKQKINSNLRPTLIDNYIFTVSLEGYLIVMEKNSGNIIRITDIFKSYTKRKKIKDCKFIDLWKCKGSTVPALYLPFMTKDNKSLIKPTGFIVGKKNIYLTTDNGKLIVIDIKTGNTLSILKIDKNKISRPSVLNQNLFIITDNSIIKLN